jgi:hypothetical protein
VQEADVPTLILNAFRSYTDLASRQKKFIVRFDDELSARVQQAWQTRTGTITIDASGTLR